MPEHCESDGLTDTVEDVSKPTIESTAISKTVRFEFAEKTHIDWVLSLSLEYAFKFGEKVEAVQGNKIYYIDIKQITEWVRRQGK